VSNNFLTFCPQPSQKAAQENIKEEASPIHQYHSSRNFSSHAKVKNTKYQHGKFGRKTLYPRWVYEIQIA
jgi:histone acetyltransferase (RNA polymerase elongator complex component)